MSSDTRRILLTLDSFISYKLLLLQSGTYSNQLSSINKSCSLLMVFFSLDLSTLSEALMDKAISPVLSNMTSLLTCGSKFNQSAASVLTRAQSFVNTLSIFLAGLMANLHFPRVKCTILWRKLGKLCHTCIPPV